MNILSLSKLMILPVTRQREREKEYRVGTKLPFTTKGGRFCEREFLALSKFMLFQALLPQIIKNLPSIIDCEPIRSFKKLFWQNLPPLGQRLFCCC